MCLAIPGRVVEVLPGELPAAVVDVAGVRRRVELGLLDGPTTPGDWVLIHVGFAMSRISEEDAIDQMRMLAVLGETDAALEEVRGYGSVESSSGLADPPVTPANDRGTP